MCCGVLNGQSYCCPTYTTGAKCFACNNGYRCYMGSPSPNICVNDGGVKGCLPSSGHSRYSRDYEGSEASSMITLMIVFFSCAVIVAALSSCMRQRRLPMAMQQQQQTVEMQVAKPVRRTPLAI